MSISTTYNIVSKNETYSLSWPRQEVVNPTIEAPIVGILTSYTEVNLYDDDGNVIGIATEKSEIPVRANADDFEPEDCEIFLYTCGMKDTGINTT